MSIPKKIDPNAQYEIKLKRAVTVGATVLNPRMARIVVKGGVLETLKADVLSAILVDVNEA